VNVYAVGELVWKVNGVEWYRLFAKFVLQLLKHCSADLRFQPHQNLARGSPFGSGEEAPRTNRIFILPWLKADSLDDDGLLRCAVLHLLGDDLDELTTMASARAVNCLWNAVIVIIGFAN